MRISLCMIVRDEEAMLAHCLQSIADVMDEIVIVDTGSADETKAIAAQFTDLIYDFPWCDDFSAARNFAFSKATGDYLLWLDADDFVSAEDAEKLRRLKAFLAPMQYETIFFHYDIAFDANEQPTFSFVRERLLRNLPQAKWVGRVHEVVVPFGRIYHADIHIRHHKANPSPSDRNLRIYEKMRAEGIAFSPREQFYYARELFEHEDFARAAAVFRKFLEEPEAWPENKLEAYRCCARCLLALQKPQEALEILLHGVTLAPPSGELCCEIGNFFFQKEDWAQAIFWYENALRAEKRTESGAFIEEDCYGYLPCIRLCICFDRLGKWETARAYNDLAGLYRPTDAAVLQNRLYFQKKFSETPA